MTKEYIKDIPNWEKDYLDIMKERLSKRQVKKMGLVDKHGRPLDG